MGFFKKKPTLTKEDLEELHNILSRFYDRTKPKKTELDDALYLRMRVNTILKSLK